MCVWVGGCVTVCVCECECVSVSVCEREREIMNSFCLSKRNLGESSSIIKFNLSLQAYLGGSDR